MNFLINNRNLIKSLKKKNSIYMGLATAEFIFLNYRPLITQASIDSSVIGIKIPIPRISYTDLNLLFEFSTTILKEQSKILDLTGSFYIIGDIHGNLHDLIRILSKIKDLETSNLLFLGDYIDRGDYSIEVLALLFSLYIKSPNKVFLLRGNHEFLNLQEDSNLKNEIAQSYGELGLYDKIHEAFQYLPLAALINKKFLCLHGGICPEILTLNDIFSLEYPIIDFSNPKISGILWSDPCSNITNFQYNSRGLGCLYGEEVIKKFLMNNNLKYLIRSHQCVDKGVQIFKKSVITLFSSSCYCDNQNYAGFIIIDEKDAIHFKRIDPLKPISRKKAIFNIQKPRLSNIPNLKASKVLKSTTNSIQISPIHKPIGIRSFGKLNQTLPLSKKISRRHSFIDN